MNCNCDCKKCGYHIANFSRELMKQNLEIKKLQHDIMLITRHKLKELKA